MRILDGSWCGRCQSVSLMVLVTIAMVATGGRVLGAEAMLKVIGAATCATKECHGAAVEKLEGRTIHNEYSTWIKNDKHAKSYSNLAIDKSKKIAKAMNIANAQESDRCLTCHALVVPKERQGEKYDISDGNSCDDCHGPAEKYLEPHSKTKPQYKQWTHAQSVAAGMLDTLDIAVRGGVCVQCHLAIDHEMLAAGHPSMTFELDAFSATMPPHWRREKPFVATQAWATGQVLCLREALRQLNTRLVKGAVKTYVDDAWGLAAGYYATSRRIAQVVAPDALKAIDADVTALAGSGGNDKDKAAKLATKDVGDLLTAFAGKVAAADYGADQAKALMAAVAGAGDDVTKGGVHVAEQVAYALDSLYRPYSKTAHPANKKEVKGVIKRILATLDKPAEFKADAFTALLKEFSAKLQ